MRLCLCRFDGLRQLSFFSTQHNNHRAYAFLYSYAYKIYYAKINIKV